MHDETLNELAATCQASLAAVRSVVGALEAQAGSQWFYVFWTSGAGAPAAAEKRPRTLLAFTTPDAALAFAQHNQLHRDAVRPRLRRLSLAQLLFAMARVPAINAILLVRDFDTPPPIGTLPAGIYVDRSMLLRLLEAV